MKTLALFFLTVSVCVVLAGCVFSYKPAISGSTVHTNSTSSANIGYNNEKDK